ncbi:MULTISPECIES: thioesterase family protein [Corynebacterium]|uniref:Acyl-CoA thioesterase n=2 Tax=Corynebacterium TaxID=1716 RepID=A0AAW5HW49_9CORY|nr:MULTISPECIES: acyl-CoA thioesterase [Corynebacterium]MCO6394517.1 acyl-CoA thioesterase [Corynebacterium lipophilum]MCQ4607372.1 acyl-CoA thioesterase [Corynebacterium pseudogenitalium]MCQ4610616.1 acyl-CoA thioesterase [Corynebacterium sp. CCUG 61414]MCQ4611672.1 acyl-CoA thioesterase [Corynebacterium sp. CCUG 51687]MCZ2117515.1 acyl-CoA thioesterase [Corynebacterium lipophilum]
MSEQNMRGRIHTHSISLRWNDFDRYGHVTNSAYIEIAQQARLAFAQEFFESQGYEFVVFVRRIEADYVRPVLPNTQAVTVDTQVIHLGNTSFTTRQEIKDAQGSVCCVIDCVQVTVDKRTASPRAITSQELGILARAYTTLDGDDELGQA